MDNSFRYSVHSFWKLTLPESGAIFIRCLLGFVRIAASLLFVWVCKTLVDIATGQLDGDINVYVAAMIGIMLIQCGNGLLSSYWEGRVTVRANVRMRSMLFESVMRSQWNGRESMHTGDMVNRIETDVSVVVDLICSRVPDVVITSIQLLAASWYLLSMSPNLMWLLIALMVIAVIGSRLFFKTVRKITMAIRKAESRIQGYMQENMLHRVVALTLAGVGRVLAGLDEQQDSVVKDTERRLGYGTISRGFMSLGFAAGYASAFLWGIFGIRSGAVTFGMMTAFLQLVGQIQSPIANLSRHIPAFIHGLTSVDRVTELMDLPKENYGEPVYMKNVPGICVDNLTYSYADCGKKVLDGFSYDFKPGTITAITGETGAGKSTLMRLLLALLHQNGGTMTIYDGETEVPVSVDTRCNFMYVPQGNTMMSGTVRQNFLMSNPDATEEEMRDALSCAAADFVLSGPGGLDMSCSEEGGGLSEGQAQRLSIARALLHPGNILILDESTSALDSETEQLVLRNLYSRCHGKKTVLFVSHREAVSQWADNAVHIGR